MSVGQASGLALAEAAAAGCQVVQYTPNQVKEAVTGWGAADKAQVQRMVQVRLGLSDATASRPTPPMPPRWRCATWPWPRCRPAWPRRREDGDDRLAARHGARAGRATAGSCSRCGGVGYLVTVTPRTLAELEPTHERVPPRPPPHPGGRPDALRLPAAATSGPRSTCSSPPTASGRRWRWPSSATHTPSALVDIVASSDLGALVPRARGRQEDGRAAAGRAAQPARSVPVLDDVSPAGWRSAVGDVREALAGLGYGSRGDPRGVARARRRPSARELLLRDALQGAGGPPCVTSSSTRRRPTSGRQSRTPASAPAASTTSSARAS